MDKNKYIVTTSIKSKTLTQAEADAISRAAFDNHPEKEEIRRVFKALAKM